MDFRISIPNVVHIAFTLNILFYKQETFFTQIKNVALLGGNWNNASNAGLMYWNVNNTTSNRNRNISTHQCCEIYMCTFQTTPLGEIHNM